MHSSLTLFSFLSHSLPTVSLRFTTPLTHTQLPLHKQNTCTRATRSACSPRTARTHAHAHTDMKSSSHCSSLFPRLSSLVQVGRPESGGRLNLSAPLTVIVRQQTHRVTHNFTSSPRLQPGLIDPTWHRGGQRNGEWWWWWGRGAAILCRSGTRLG